MPRLKFKARLGDGETKHCEWRKEKRLKMREQCMQSLINR